MNGTWDEDDAHTFDGVRTVFGYDMIRGRLIFATMRADGDERADWCLEGIGRDGDRYALAHTSFLTFASAEAARDACVAEVTRLVLVGSLAERTS